MEADPTVTPTIMAGETVENMAPIGMDKIPNVKSAAIILSITASGMEVCAPSEYNASEGMNRKT
eukprot:CAMPEP_0171297178 /NCGR_PEP_ID=MMETSP0816-20121228/5966_1 /TAXON_ID=420281 /ORGANISM="Proboscia inermis, Strain CCAP1064/1" /LENGTH=63 /DNA_ID=CAMNT_0011771305 /DNA_START=410 /DNA_END=604 /DNA_ORIENTATION=+